MISKGMARIAQKLKKSVPKADVIVTNPTHYAVALQYDRNNHSAPIVVAKGTDFIAQRIREIGKEHNIPILERKALARALYASTEVGSEIPRDLFKAVAEVLAFVFRLKRTRPQGTATS
jgi:flagellar biosynthetic protein FlhB